jgi:hypothetical protein
MKSNFRLNQWVKPIGGEQEMRVFEHLMEEKTTFNSALGNSFPITKNVYTGKIKCVWIDKTEKKEVYGDFDERNLEACD